MPLSKSQLLFTVVILIVTGAAIWQTREPAMGTGYARWEAPDNSPAKALRLSSPSESLNVSGDAEPSVHAVSAVELRNGTLRAFWFGGSREGASDVAIYTSTLAPGPNVWSEPEVAISRSRVERDTDRSIRKLGNPVAAIDSNGVLWLFVVSVSVGGWSGSAINVTYSYNEGKTWEDIDRLVTSPFANISTLIKGPPIHYRDGALGLPVYHEMVSKFPQIVRIDTFPGDRNRVEGRTTIGESRGTLQPWIIPTTESHAVAFLRSSHSNSKFVHLSETKDGGKNWSPARPTSLPNPNASVAAAHLGEDKILLAYNHSEKNRDNLTLAITKDNGSSWEEVGAVETKKRLEGENEFHKVEYSYPWLLKTRDGDIHLLYTWNRTEIRHLRLTRKEEITK